MTASQPLKRIILAPGRERRLVAGHGWAFSNEIAKPAAPADGKAPSPAPEAGEVVELAASTGRPLGIGFYNPNSLIAWRFLARERVDIDAGFFRDRLQKALDARTRLVPGERSYRLAFGESDGLPGLVIDRYGDYLVLQVLCAGMEARLDAIREALEGLLKPAGIFLKNDHRARALEGLPSECRVLSGEVPPAVEISEGGIRYSVPLTEGQKTGFYFDQRENRAYLEPFWKGRRVLDLHCYIGAFALRAAKNGAKAVFGVDSSEAAVELARKNAKDNGLEAEFREGDAEEALRAFAGGAKSERPDMIHLDPPSLAPSKKHLPKALRAYVRMNSLALKVLSRGGLLATSTCSHHVSREDFVDILRAAQAKLGRSCRLLALRGQAADHPVLLSMPETEYLNFALIEVL
ncbi:MAG: class I SAM-dependent rRNA methyltransferase [Elusimicrobia bacterium]|nr:class I SAM-dependent rRNA methyltransferase [Elusimicrobiota bacterium]